MSNDADSDGAFTTGNNDEEEDSSPPSSPPLAPAKYQWKREPLIYTHHGLNLYIRMPVLEEIKKVLKDVGGKAAIKLLKGGQIGRLLDLRRRDSANVPLHHLLTRQLEGPNIPPYEAWFYVGGRILRFIGADYAIITGLHFGYTEFDPHAQQHQISRTSLWYTHFRGSSTNITTLRKRFNAKSLGNNPINYIKAANLLMYYYFLMCRDNVVIEDWAWALVEDLEAWDWFPWGAYSYQGLFYYLNNVVLDDVSDVVNYHLFGPVWALQIWFYELIPSFGALCGVRDTVPIEMR